MANKKLQEEAKIRELQSQIKRLEETIARLSLDPSYEILTRQALEIDLEARRQEVRFVIFGDIDYLHNFNAQYGHEEANRRIRRALHFRSSDIVLMGKWYSGDEIAILINSSDREVKGFMERLQREFFAEGMSITVAFVKYSGKLASDVSKAKKVVDTIKAARGSSR